MIFFRSCSQLADNPAYKAVIEEMIIVRYIIVGWGFEEIRIIKNTPAVTRVDEWTKAEIGVGADIAIGSHAENGNCALFVHLVSISINIIIKGNDSFMFNSHIELNNIIPIDNRMKISPIRFLSKVIDPEPEEELFW